MFKFIQKHSVYITDRIMAVGACLIFAALYHYVDPMVALMFGLYVLYTSIADIYKQVDQMKGDQESLWKSIFSTRKPF